MASTKKNTSAGLSGITAGEQAISTVGIGLGLNYRGYDIKVFIIVLYSFKLGISIEMLFRRSCLSIARWPFTR